MLANRGSASLSATLVVERNMPKVSVVTPDKAHPAAPPPGMTGSAETIAYLDGAKDALHLHLHRIAAGERLEIGPLPSDCVVFVWRGDAVAGGRPLAAGSSAIVERGGTLAVAAEVPSEILTFRAAKPDTAPEQGGHVHLLPAERVPSYRDETPARTVGGRMHADSSYPTTQVWLHESILGIGPEPSPETARLGVHSHTEDEVIFVTSGAMRLGQRQIGPGTALAVAADTMYSFGVGPEGLSFVNFRAAEPKDIHFADGRTMSETGYWLERVQRPEYLEPAPAH